MNTATYEALQAENKTLKRELIAVYESKEKLKVTRDKLLESLKEVAESGLLPDGDGVDIPTMLWLERLVQEGKAA